MSTYMAKPGELKADWHVIDASGQVTEGLALCKIEEWDHLTAHILYGQGYPAIPSWQTIPFFKPQKKIVLRNCGLISPDDIEEYIAIGGYQSLYKVLIDANPEVVIEQIKAAKLRGRGGAGFLTGLKWEFLRKMASGTTVGQIAQELPLSVPTVSPYRARILEKMGMSTNAELIRYAVSHHLV